MPDLREVFEMVKQQTEPDLDSWSEQERLMRRAQRNRRVGAFALVAAIAAAVAVLVAGELRDPDPGSSVIPATNGPSVVSNGTGEFALVDLSTGATTGTGIVPSGSEVDASPDGTRITYVGLGDVVYVANADGSNAQAFAQTDAPGQAVAPRWSPDGTKIVYQGTGVDLQVGNLYVLDVQSGRVEQITDLGPVRSGFYYMAPTFSQDGESILFRKPPSINGRLDIWTVPTSGGEPTLVLRNSFAVDVAPSGNSIAFVEARHVHGDLVFGDLYVARSDGTGARDRKSVV